MNPEILKLIDRVQIALQVGESHFREFKSGYQGESHSKTPRPWKDISKDISDTLVGFANADGGELIVGVEDDHTVTGLDFSDIIIDNLLKSPQTRVHLETPLPTPRANKLMYEGNVVLYFSVPKGTEYIYLTSDGRCLQRKDRDTIPVASERISFSRSEIVSREYDRAFVDGADITDLDIVLVSQVAERISKGMSVEKCLQHLQLAEFDGSRFRLRKAALLLFAKEPSKWHPRLQVRILKIDGVELKSGDNFNVSYDDEVTDNILNLVESSWDLLRPHLTETRLSKEALFRTQIIYPELACREALINAIAHRDYSIEGRGIEVRVYLDRLEILSPGGLISSIRINDLVQLKGTHQSRNSLVARVLREIGYMRELGEGIRRIYELMRLNDLTAPELRSSNNEFAITLHHKSTYPPEVKIWLDSFVDLNLTRDEKSIVRLGYNSHVISPAEIWEAVGIVDTDYYRQILESLRQKGILYRSVGRNQAYLVARDKHVSKKSVPQFTVRIPRATDPVTIVSEVADDTDYAKVFVGNVPYNTTEIELEGIFRVIGEVVDVKMPINHETGRPRGFAFVEFEHNSDAEKAIQLSGELKISGRNLYVQKYERRL